MKKLSVFLLLLAVVGCQPESKYPSMYEAKDACKEWDGGSTSRHCEVEGATNQVLGIDLVDGKDTVVERFRY